MKYRKICKLVATISFFAALSIVNTSARAVTMEETIVTASRIEEGLKYSPDSVTVITEEEMEKKGRKTLIEALRDVPGIVIPQNGAFGGTSSIFIRGTSNAHALIMIDGVRVSDPITADGNISISDISTDNIEKIEVVRGAQSVLYGSAAIGGVINIITKKGEGKPKITLSSEVGSFESFREKIGVNGSSGKFSYSASVERFDTQGVSKADDDLAGVEENDYYHTNNISTRISGSLSDTVRVGLSALFKKSKMDYDSTGADTDKVLDSTITTVAANYDQDLLEWWQHMIKVGTTSVQREYTKNGGAFDGEYNGISRQISWQHNLFIRDFDTVTAGYDYEEQEGDNQGTYSSITKKSTNTGSIFIQNKLTPFEGASFTLGYRAIDHQTFGSEDTYKAALAYFFKKTETKLHGSYGTGFRAPSLYQLYSSYGDESLKPETSKGYDVGVEQFFLDEKIHCSLTWFYNELEDMIAWDGVTSKYKNISAADMKGWEAGLSYALFDWLSFDANYTYTDARDETPGGSNEGKYLTYRPKHSGNASVNIKPMEKLNINFNSQYVGKRYKSTDNSSEVPDHLIFNLAASYDLREWIELFGRIENLSNENYSSIHSYGQPGISFYGGVKMTF